MDQMIEDGLKIRRFASDQHVGIRKKLWEDFKDINRQFDVWHYAKSLKKINTSKPTEVRE